jgi:hypothetical protein
MARKSVALMTGPSLFVQRLDEPEDGDTFTDDTKRLMPLEVLAVEDTSEDKLRLSQKLSIVKGKLRHFAILSIKVGASGNSTLRSGGTSECWLFLPQQNAFSNFFSTPELVELKRLGDVFEDVSAIKGANFTLTGGDYPEQIEGTRASVSAIRMKGIRPLIGGPLAKTKINLAVH